MSHYSLFAFIYSFACVYLRAVFYFSLQNKTSEASSSDCFTLGTALVCGIIVKYRSLFFRKKNADLLADALEFMYTPWPDNSNTYALRSGLVDVIGDKIFGGTCRVDGCCSC